MADLKVKYAAKVTITLSSAGLATSATRVAGQESTQIDNTVNLYVDALVEGKIATGTTPTAGQIDIWVYASHTSLAATPRDVIDGLDSAETFTDEQSRNSLMRLAHVIATDATSDQVYQFGPFSVAALFGGTLPPFWGLFVSHSTVAALNAVAGNHLYEYTGVQYQSI